QLGGIQDIIEQTRLANITVEGKTKTEKIILQRVGDQLEKSDLTLHRKPNAIVFDLLTRHTGLHHERCHVDPCRTGACTGESRQPACSAGRHADQLEPGPTHETCHPASHSTGSPHPRSGTDTRIVPAS